MDVAHGAALDGITELLARWRGGDHAARDELVAAVYGQVRVIAQRSLRAVQGATLSPTDLAHEALIRLLGRDAAWEDRQHFYNVVAQATRQILVDAARQRLAQKRGAGAVVTTLSAAEQAVPVDDGALLRVNDALAELAQRDPRSAQVIELTYFGGFERTEIAAVLGVSVPTIDRDLRFGRAWLKRTLEA